MINEQGNARERPNPAEHPAPAPIVRKAPSPRAWLTLFGVAAFVIFFDQVSKRLIDQHLALFESWPSASWPVRLTHAANSGAAFSILQNQSTFLILTSIIGVAAILFFFFYPPLDHALLRVALGLMLGGAAGNLIDRVLFGSVTDFIQFPHYPAFNVADSCIVIGVALLMWFLLFRDGRQTKDRGNQERS